MQLEGKKKAICRTQVEVDDEILRGTGFLVSSGEVLTCAHCLGRTEEAAKQVQKVKLYFSRWPEGQREVLATPKEGGLSWELDLAVLVLNEPVPEEVVPLGLGRASCNEEWTLFGFPKQARDSGLVIEGKVTDPNGEYQGKKVLQLNSSATRDSVKGASGSPIFVGEYVVGMLTNQLLGRNPANDVAPALEVIYALPSEEIATFSGTSLAAQMTTSPPAPENSPEELLELLEELLERLPLANTFAGRTSMLPNPQLELGRTEFDAKLVDLGKIVYGIHRMDGTSGIKKLIRKASKPIRGTGLAKELQELGDKLG